MGLAKSLMSHELKKRVLPSDDSRDGALRCIPVDVVWVLATDVRLCYTALDAVDRHIYVYEWQGGSGSGRW